MSDFLSSFNKDNYDPEKKKRSAEAPQSTASERKPEANRNGAETNRKQQPGSQQKNQSSDQSTLRERVTKELQSSERSSPPPSVPNVGSRRKEEETEFDPTYKKKQNKKKRMIILGSIILCGLGFFFYYQMTHIKLPDFTGKEAAEARSWANENGMKIELEQKYDNKTAANQVLGQNPKPNAKVKKGSKLKLTTSLGADPEEQLALPNFMAMSKSEAEKWIKEQLTDNISIIEEYHETEAAGKALRMEFTNGEVTKENYRRKDKLKLYYSKGKETYTKSITVPDFTKKTKSEVENWAKNNEIDLIFEEVSSNDVPLDTVISQNIAKDEKIAKKDKMTVTVSLGKGMIVPDFAQYTLEDAATALEGLNIQVKTLYTENMSYGQLVSQSVAAGTELTSKDEAAVKVVYSAGQPYLKDLRGTVEGDLQKLFYDEFQSKGANINYQIRYVDSAEAKGTVVDMSARNQYLPLNFTVYLDVSLGNLSGAQQYGNNNNQQGQGESDNDEPSEAV
ncbi:PASTA domain-containing protein [Enterococcus sp. LJL51]|uniref:PASTA domain-containing protein n=1 Tax=Enterococcus sp. LJL51 TaxID=3416656 RepID=UPI003CEDB1F2